MFIPLAFRPSFTQTPDISSQTQNTTQNFVQVEVTDPTLTSWGEDARKLMILWYPKIERMLKDKVEKHPKTVYLVIDTHGNGVAGTGGRRIEVNGDYVRKHPTDIGLVVHELTHVVQAYPHYNPSWLVEGIADYVRWFNYEPVSVRPHPKAATVDYHHGYREVAAFLNWATLKYDRNLVPKLNHALQTDTYSDQTWQDSTHHSFDDLWNDYVQSLKS